MACYFFLQEKSNELLFTDSHQTVDSHDEGDYDYWAHRIENLKKEHRIINKIIETEYEKTIEKTNKMLETPQLSPGRIQKLKPCYDWRAKVIKSIYLFIMASPDLKPG